MEIEPVRKESVVQITISKIKELIEEEYFTFGERLPPERKLSNLLGVSLPSLREALRALSILGIVEIKAGDGTYLRSALAGWPSEPFSLFFELIKPIHVDLFEARKGIEGIIAEIAAQKRSEDDLRRMEAVLKKMRNNTTNRDEYIKYEIEFHQAIINAASNVVLRDLMEKMYKLLYESRKRTVEYLKDVYRESYLKHYKIYKYIKEKNTEKSRKAMVDHLTDIEKFLVREAGQ